MSLSKQEIAYGNNGIILRMEMDYTTKLEINSSLIAINNGVKQLMQLQNSNGPQDSLWSMDVSMLLDFLFKIYFNNLFNLIREI